MKKCETELTEEEKNVLKESKALVELVENRKQKIQLNKERLKEIEDEPQVIQSKALLLAHLISGSKSVVVYTGAGISTAAHIPDYRGPNGIWTQLKNGSSVPRHCDLVMAGIHQSFTHSFIDLFNN